jgi:hypothetical protein
MTLDGGLGDVVASSMGADLGDTLSEKMITITGNHHNIWLLTHRVDTNVFCAYEITATGVNPVPIMSKAGYFTGYGNYGVGTMKVSPNRRQLILNFIKIPLSYPHGSELYDFDPATGVVSNARLIDTVHDAYGAEFSPDNTKLYTQEAYPPFDTFRVFQYNLALSGIAAIRASKTLIATVLYKDLCDMRLGPDNRIYFLGTYDSAHVTGGILYPFIDCIKLPNLSGAACNHTPHVLKLLPGTGAQAGLPNKYVIEDTVSATSVFSTSEMVSLKLFPNPSASKVMVELPHFAEKISVLNAEGSRLFEVLVNEKKGEIDVSDLAPGTYFLSAEGVGCVPFTRR